MIFTTGIWRTTRAWNFTARKIKARNRKFFSRRDAGHVHQHAGQLSSRARHEHVDAGKTNPRLVVFVGGITIPGSKAAIFSTRRRPSPPLPLPMF
ncbi:MAG: hypothetical protein WDM76_19130 [Limisphaerales bacterium]